MADSLYDLLVASARSVLDEQRADGSFPPGRNGVYRDKLTPVRSTASWVLSILKSYEITGEESFRQAAVDGLAYLLGDEVRPYGRSFLCRESTTKDRCNGVLGQSFPLMAFVRGAEVLDEERYLNAALQTYYTLPFDPEIALWDRIEVTGKNISIDRTLNHQILFASAAAMLCNHDSRVADDVRRFLQKLPIRMGTHDSGLIKHHVSTNRSELSLVRSSISYRYLLAGLAIHSRNYVPKNTIRDKEVSYHSVNLYGLARLHCELPDHPIWDSPLIESIIDFVDNESYISAITSVDRSFTNDLNGFHLGLCYHRFRPHSGIRSPEWWVNEQMRRGYDFERNRLDKEAANATNQASKIFVASFLPDFKLEFLSPPSSTDN